MKVSTRGRYGLRALVDMTIHSNNAPVSLVQVANRQKISLNYLEQVFGTLRKAGIVVSVKGAGGGYKLARDAESITVKEVLEALEGTFSIIDRIPGEEQDAVQEAIEKLVWSRIDETVNTFLEQKTLKMLTDEYRKNWNRTRACTTFKNDAMNIGGQTYGRNLSECNRINRKNSTSGSKESGERTESPGKSAGEAGIL